MILRILLAFRAYDSPLEPRFGDEIVHTRQFAGRDVQKAHGRWSAKFNVGAF